MAAAVHIVLSSQRVSLTANGESGGPGPPVCPFWVRGASVGGATRTFPRTLGARGSISQFEGHWMDPGGRRRATTHELFDGRTYMYFHCSRRRNVCLQFCRRRSFVGTDYQAKGLNQPHPLQGNININAGATRGWSLLLFALRLFLGSAGRVGRCRSPTSSIIINISLTKIGFLGSST